MNKIKKAIFIYKTYGLKAFVYKSVNFLYLKLPFKNLKFERITYANKYSFENHDAALRKRYDSPEPLVVAKISDGLLSDIYKLIQDVGDHSIISTKLSSYYLCERVN